MKKTKLFALLSLGFLALGGIVLGTVRSNNSYQILRAEPDSSEPADPVDDPVDDPAPDPVDDPAEPTEEVFECKVVLEAPTHGKLSVDKKEGHVGDLITVNADADLFYLIKSVSVNGTDLVEDEEIRGKFVFALVEGENKLSAKFVIDEELLGKASTMVEQASNKDWTNLFSLKNVITLVSWLLSGGLLITMVRYYIKDKKLEKKVESKIQKTVAEVVPEATKEIILKSLEQLLAPYFAKIEANTIDIQETAVVLCRCFALMQENTPEARIAITKELSSLKLGDKASIAMIEEKIKEFIQDQSNKTANILAQLSNIQNENKEIVKEEKLEELPASEPMDDGTQI